jgi:excisionase family DNA binding protein
MIADLENGLRALITEIVRKEVHAALAEVKALDQYLPTRVAAEVADVAPGTIRRWIREGRLASHHAGRVVRVRRADLKALLQIGTRQDVNDLTPEQLARRDFG